MAAGMVLSGVGEEERSSTGPSRAELAAGCTSVYTFGRWALTDARSGLAMAGERRARPGACASGMVSEVEAGVDHGRPQAGSSAPCPEARPRAEPTLGLAGKCDR